MAKQHKWSSILSAVVVAVVTTTAAAADKADRAMGEQIAARICVGCHGTGGPTGAIIQGVYVPSFSEIARRPQQTQERVQAFVMTPRHPMPGLQLDSRELRHVTEYVMSFRDGEQR